MKPLPKETEKGLVATKLEFQPNLTFYNPDPNGVPFLRHDHFVSQPKKIVNEDIYVTCDGTH